MRIAFFHELPEGGALSAVKELGLRMRKNHTTDLFYVSEKKDLSVKKHFSKVTHFPFKAKTWKGRNWRVRLYKDTLELIKLDSLHKTIAEKIDEKKYDVVFVNASKFTQAPFILKHLKTMTFFYCHDPNLRMAYEKILDIPSGLDVGRRNYEKLNRFIRRYIDVMNFKQADHIIANSKFVKKGVKKTYRRESTVVYLGVDTTVFKKEKTKKEFDILFVGSYEPVDGFELLDMALKKIRSHISLRVLDFKAEWISSKRKMSELYNRARIVVCLTHNEPFGLVPLEAMACGVPVIATSEGGYKETIQNSVTGYLIKRDPNELAGKIKLLLNKHDLYHALSHNAEEQTKRDWSWEKSAKNLIQEFKRHD